MFPMLRLSLKVLLATLLVPLVLGAAQLQAPLARLSVQQGALVSNDDGRFCR